MLKSYCKKPANFVNLQNINCAYFFLCWSLVFIQ